MFLFTPSLVGFLGATIAVTLAMSLAHTMEAFVSTLTGRAGPAARAWATEVLTVPLANVASAALGQLSALGNFIADEEEVVELVGYYYVNNQTYYYTSNFSRSCPPARPCSSTWKSSFWGYWWGLSTTAIAYSLSRMFAG